MDITSDKLSTLEEKNADSRRLVIGSEGLRSQIYTETKVELISVLSWSFEYPGPAHKHSPQDKLEPITVKPIEEELSEDSYSGSSDSSSQIYAVSSDSDSEIILTEESSESEELLGNVSDSEEDSSFEESATCSLSRLPPIDQASYVDESKTSCELAQTKSVESIKAHLQLQVPFDHCNSKPILEPPSRADIQAPLVTHSLSFNPEAALPENLNIDTAVFSSVGTHPESSSGGLSGGRQGDLQTMSEPWNLQGFNPQGSSATGSAGAQFKLYNPATFQNEQIADQQNGGIDQGAQAGQSPHGQVSGDAGKLHQSDSWNQAWNQWDQGSYAQPETNWSQSNQWYQPVQLGGQDQQQANGPNFVSQQNQAASSHPQPPTLPQEQEQAMGQSGYDWNAAMNAQPWTPQPYNPAAWQQGQPQQQAQQDWNNPQPVEAQNSAPHYMGYDGQYYQGSTSGYSDQQASLGTNNNNSEASGEMGVGLNSSVETGQHEQAQHGSPEQPTASGQSSDVIEAAESGTQPSPQFPSVPPAAQAEAEKPVLFTSNSFNKLPHTPSPFDELSGGDTFPEMLASQPNKHNDSLLATVANQFTPSHSRDSSMGGNVQFIVGSGASSLSNSVTHSPFQSQRSPNDSPKSTDQSQEKAAPPPQAVPDGLPLPPEPYRVDQGEGVMASGQSQQYYEPQQVHFGASLEHSAEHTTGNATGTHQTQGQPQGQPDFAAHGNWHTYPENQQSVSPPTKHARPPSTVSDAASEKSEPAGIKSSVSESSSQPVYQRSNSQQSAKSVDSLNNAFGILPSPHAHNQLGSPHAGSPAGLPFQNPYPSASGPPLPTPPLTGSSGGGDGASPHPTPPLPPTSTAVGAQAGAENTSRRSTPRNMTYQGATPTSHAQQSGPAYQAPGVFPPTHENLASLSESAQPDHMQPDVVPPQVFIPSPVGAASNTLAGNHGEDPLPGDANVKGHHGSHASALSEGFSPESTPSPLKPGSIVTPEDAQPAPGRPLSLDVHHKPGNTNAAPTSPEHQLSIYATPIQPHPDSPFQPPLKAASPAGSDLTANYQSLAGPANMPPYQPLQPGSAHLQSHPNANIQDVHPLSNVMLGADSQPKNSPAAGLMDTTNQPANQKQLVDEPSMMPYKGESAGPLTVAHHMQVHRNTNSLSPAATLLENPTPASPVQIVKPAPLTSQMSTGEPNHVHPLPKNVLQTIEPAHRPQASIGQSGGAGYNSAMGDQKLSDTKKEMFPQEPQNMGAYYPHKQEAAMPAAEVTHQSSNLQSQNQQPTNQLKQPLPQQHGMQHQRKLQSQLQQQQKEPQLHNLQLQQQAPQNQAGLDMEQHQGPDGGESMTHAFIAVQGNNQGQPNAAVSQVASNPMPPAPTHVTSPTQSQSDHLPIVTSVGGNTMPTPAAPQPTPQQPPVRDQRQPQGPGQQYGRQESQLSVISDDSISRETRKEPDQSFDRRQDNHYRSSDRRSDLDQSRSSRYDDRYQDHHRQSRDPRYDDRSNRSYQDKMDRPSSRGPGYERPKSRQYYNEEEYERPRSRQSTRHPDDRPRSRQGYPEDRPRSRQGPPDDPYYRPRSRQGYEGERPPSRPSSRQSDRPPSRQGDEEPRQSSRRAEYDEYGYRRDPYYRRQDDYYRDYHRSRSGDYGYQDYYGNRDYDYYYGRDRRAYDDRYYQYYHDNRYARGYLEEMQSYGQQYDYHQGQLDYDRRSYHSASRGSTPGPDVGPGYYGSGYGGDAYSHHSVSRGSTPGLPDPMAMYQQQQQQQQVQHQQQQSVNYDPHYGYSQQPQEYDRRSHHTGSRSATPSADRNGAEHFAREFHQGSRPSSRSSGYEQSPISAQQSYHDYYANQSGYYGEQHHGGESSYWDQQQYGKKERGRMTPAKFSVAHVKVCFGPSGHMIKVLPNRPADGQPAQVEIQEVDTDLKLSPEAEELHLFPGPLVKGETHKNDVLLFCRKKAQECHDNINITDRDSAVLMWNYLELLIKHNGVMLGTDVADLLLDGHEPSTAEYRKTGIAIRQSTARSTPETDDGAVVTTDRSFVNKNAEDELTDRFRHLVLHGRKKDGLEWAMKNNLWGHALFLASKMDPKTHASIMTRFANTAMKMNDPLQTLYQLMSGRQPAAVTLVADDKWGDWRPHLAMMLANNSSKPELDRKSLITLGDTLATKGCLFASQFCYLMGQVTFGVYSKKSSKIVLIGSSHSSSPSFAEFATNEAIQCTEVYEYAQMLGNQVCPLPGLQAYKFIYATRLVDYGLAEEALQYCEVLANNILLAPTLFTAVLVRQVYELANKLKYNDPQRQFATEDCGDPFWLQQLQTVLQRFDDGLLQTASGTETPTVGAASTAASSEIGELTSGMGDQNQVYAQQYGQQTDQYNQEYGQYGYQQNYDPSQTQQTWNQSGWDSSGQWGTQTQQWDPNTANYEGSYLQYQQQPTGDESQANAGDQAQNQESNGAFVNQLPMPTHQEPNSAHPHQHQQHQHQQQEDVVDHSFQPFGGRKLPEDINLASSINSNGTEATVTSQTTASSEESQLEDGTPSVQPSNTNYWAAQQAPPPAVELNTSDNSDTGSDSTSESTPRSTPTLPSAREPCPNGEAPPKSTSLPSGGTLSRRPPYLRELGKPSKPQPKEETQLPSPSSPGSETQKSPSTIAPPKEIFQFGVPPTQLSERTSTAPLGVGTKQPTIAEMAQKKAPPSANNQPPPPPKKENKDGDKNKLTSNGSSWIGGFMKKILPRGKNEMILPDDSKPSIVWDDDKKKWIDTTKSEEEQTLQNAPPPKDSELPNDTPPATPPQHGGGPPSVGTPGTNKFSRQKTRGARGQYVDVLRGSASKAAPTNPNLFNVMPKSHTVPANLFIPSVSEGAREEVKQLSATETHAQQQQPQQQPQQQQQQMQQDYSHHQQLDYNQQHDYNQLQQQQQQHIQQQQQNQYGYQENQQMAPPRVEELQENLSRSSSGSELNREVQHYMVQGNEPEPAGPAPPPSGPAPPPSIASYPMMFNPAQFSNPTQTTAQQTGPGRGLKYGQRRAYPK